ncbi:hypothetical protein Osc1_23420 [Hominimerdicola sp. 21CYCFAH17_S]
MNKKERNYISEKLQILIGTKISDINRNHGDIWIDFADEHGKCYILLMQTLFRLCDNEKILITDTDKYKNFESESNNDLFEWDVHGANIFDKWVASNKNDLLNSLTVQKVKITEFGDLVIIFDKSITLTVFLEVTNDTECWRFFENGNDEKYDLIVLGNCININLLN